MQKVTINGQDLTIAQVVLVARQDAEVEISADAWARVQASRAFLERIAHSGKIIYAINTGFGSNASVLIDDAQTTILQTNLLLSHATGVGKPLERDAVRAMMLIRLNTLLAGYSGIRTETLELLQALLNHKIHPIIPSQGSVGASGDLCPLSHMAIALLGEGEVNVDTPEGQMTLPAHEALTQAGLTPIRLAYKEGIALNNGTTFMTALGVLAVHDSQKMLEQALQSVAIVLEAIMARKQAFDARIHQIRNHKAQLEIAQRLQKILEGSALFGKSFEKSAISIPQNTSENWLNEATLQKLIDKKTNPQDAYSIRCTAQILGASLHAIQHVEEVLAGELNAVTDNPLLFEETEEVLSGGNFHGQPLALPLDYLKIALAEVGNLLERQVNKLVDAHHNDCLPAFLVEEAGLNSGFMIPQYVCASLVSENKVLAHPASVDSIPTSANQEDHVSMGSISARQALEILENVQKILSIHALTACQALDLRQKQLTHWGLDCHMSPQTKVFYDKIRAEVPHLSQDRLLYKDIARAGKVLEIK